MKEQYEQWVAENVTSDGYGQCAELTLRMEAAFPELTRVRGHYSCPVWGERAHWWLIATDGKVVDPTKAQFPSNGCGVYDSWTEGEEEPTGKCPNCGGYIYGGRAVCSDKCHHEYIAYLADYANGGGG